MSKQDIDHEVRDYKENNADNIGVGGWIILIIVAICFVAAMWCERFVRWLAAPRCCHLCLRRSWQPICKHCCERELNLINFPYHGSE